MTRGTPFQAGQSGNPGGKPKSAELSALARRYTVDALRGLVAVARLEASKHDSAVTAACKALLDLGYPGHQRAGFADGEAANVLHLHLLAVAGAPAQPTQLLATTSGQAQLTPEMAEPEGPTREEWLEQLAEDGMLPPEAAAMPHEALPLWDAKRSEHGFAKTEPPIAGNVAVHQAPIIGFSEEKASPDADLHRAIRQGTGGPFPPGRL